MKRISGFCIAAAVLAGCATHVEHLPVQKPEARKPQLVHGITQEIAPDGTRRFVWCSECPAPTHKTTTPAGESARTAVVLFDLDSAEIRSDQVHVLESMMDRIDRGDVVILYGFTDSRGTSANNQRLAERRTETVRSWIAAHAGRQVEFHTTARGQCCYAREPGPSPVNRRVEIYIKEETFK